MSAGIYALSLWQPYPSLVADGIKTTETRSWPAPERLEGSRIAIHATKRGLPGDEWPPDLCDVVAAMLDRPDLIDDGPALRELLPRGAVLCTVHLVVCRQVIAHTTQDVPRAGHNVCRVPVAVTRDRAGRTGHVLIDRLGDYSVGRWLWLFAGVDRFAEPIPARGAQGVWTWRR